MGIFANGINQPASCRVFSPGEDIEREVEGPTARSLVCGRAYVKYVAYKTLHIRTYGKPSETPILRQNQRHFPRRPFSLLT